MSKNRRQKLKLVGASSSSEGPAKAGKVKHDSRGNAVWDWAIDTGVLARKTAAELLGSLDKPGLLMLEEDAPANGEDEWSGDPYNRSR